MTKKVKKCELCGKICNNADADLHDYAICSDCKSKLGLLHDGTIRRHISAYRRAQERDPDNPSYEEEIRSRLARLEKDYISKRIKLLHVLERLGCIGR